MSDHIAQIQYLAGTTVPAAERASEMQPGALNKYDNDEWMFTGDGATTPAQVMGRIMEVDLGEVDLETDPEMKALHGHPAAARYAAVQMLMTRNPHLLQREGASPPTPQPDSAVPSGQQFYAQGGPTLKQLLAPLKNHIGEIEQVVARLAQPSPAGGVGRGSGRAEQKVIGNVRSQGRPIE